MGHTLDVIHTRRINSLSCEKTNKIMKLILLILFILSSSLTHAQSTVERINKTQSYGELPIIEAKLQKDCGRIFWTWDGKQFSRLDYKAPAGTILNIRKAAYAEVDSQTKHAWKLACTTSPLLPGDTLIDYNLARLAFADSTKDQLQAWHSVSIDFLKEITDKRLEEEKTRVKLLESRIMIEIQFTPEGVPFEAYESRMDYRKNCKTIPYYGQDIELYTAHWSNDSTLYVPDPWELINDRMRPIDGLKQEWLQTDTIYVMMQKHFKLAIRAYMKEEECAKQSEIHNVKYYTIPYYYRDKAAWDELYRRRLEMLNR